MTRILIIEDSRHTRDQLTKRLRGYPTLAEVVAFGALAPFYERRIGQDTLGPFDVAILDVQLPDGRGLNLVPLLGEALVIIATAAPEDAPKGFCVVRKGPLWIAEIENIIAAWKARKGRE